MLFGYNGKILRVNLTDNIITTEEINEEFCRRYLGGAGFAVHYLLEEIPAGTDALAPENKLVFALGPITGIALSGASRNSVAAKSPMTGGIALSEVGGSWGAELKKAGFDAIIIEGKANKPVYLWVHDGNAELRDANSLWGMTTKETEQAIRQEQNDTKVSVATIGPAGENLVRYACIMIDLVDAAGRGGTGAVMGSKKLKAIAVRGNKNITLADSEGIKHLNKWFAHNLENMQVAPITKKYGTGAYFEANVNSGNAPVNNFRDGVLNGAANLDAISIKETISIGMHRCPGCIIGCKKVVSFNEPYEYDSDYGGPEYEALAALGSNCGISNVKAVCKANELCNAYSLDSISTGAVIAFAMECFENGFLTTVDTGGIELRFGNEEALLEVIELIAHRKGIGQILAEGTARVAEKLGSGSERFAVQVKGLEAGMHEPRLKAGLGLGFMVNPHGADHCCNLQDTLFAGGTMAFDYAPLGYGENMPVNEIGPRKVALFRIEQQIRILRDCMIMCWFCMWPPVKLAEITSAATGWNTGIMELLRIAERVTTMARVFNHREGLSAKDDVLPPRFFEPKASGALSDKALDPNDMDAAKRYYYVLMGWNSDTGIPLPEKLEELGISSVMKHL